MVSFRIKERRAVRIFESFLEENGFELVKLNCEDALQSIIAKGKKVDYELYKSDVDKHSNDFIILGKTPIFVEVRFLEGKLKKEDYKHRGNLGDIVLVFITKDEFYIAKLNDFIKNGEIEAIEDNGIIKVRPALVDKYKEELKKQLK